MGHVAALTGITTPEWREVAAAFPALGRSAGPRAAARRLLLSRLASRRLATGRWAGRLEGAPPSAAPAVYVSAHLGSLQGLRYALRSRGVPAATALGPENLVRSEAERQDRIFDTLHPIDFPHVLPAGRPHRLRAALRSGSLVLAADLPAQGGVEFPLLGGRARLDRRPFRLARVAGVARRPVDAQSGTRTARRRGCGARDLRAVPGGDGGPFTARHRRSGVPEPGETALTGQRARPNLDSGVPKSEAYFRASITASSASRVGRRCSSATVTRGCAPRPESSRKSFFSGST
jgi:hypothetical protein